MTSQTTDLSIAAGSPAFANLRNLWLLKTVCRWALGLVWIWEGLVPKILLPTAVQTKLVEHSGLYWPNPDAWLVLLGGGMIVAGILTCLGWKERFMVAALSLAMTILIFLVVGNHPTSLSDLHGGIAKDLCLYACAYVVWILSPVVPRKLFRSHPVSQTDCKVRKAFSDPVE